MAAGIDTGGVRPGAVTARRRAATLPLGAPCPNCGTALAGAWCHGCGQSSEDFHRSLWRLGFEAVEGFFDLDSRLWRTLPRLFFNPAGLTRDYLDGRRAAQTPPLRMFLVVVVLVFLAAGLGEHAPSGPVKGINLELDRNSSVSIAGDPAASKWMVDRIKKVAANPAPFEASLAIWAQRLVFLALPISAALLGLTFFWRRSVYLFDHLIFSMHSLSFQGLLLAGVMLSERLSSWFGLLIFAAPVHLFAHLKGAYGIGVVGTLARMSVLFIGSLIGFIVIMIGLVLIGLYEVGA